eukprot:gene16150-biopygen23246
MWDTPGFRVKIPPGTCIFFLTFLADAPDPAPAPAQREWVGGVPPDICGCSGCYTGESRDRHGPFRGKSQFPGVTGQWRGRGAGYMHFFWLGWRGRGAGMARAWCGHVL